MATQKRENSIPVEKELAMHHALMSFRRSWAGNVPGFNQWGTAEIDTDPLVIYDINGEPLFYEFNIMEGKQMLGRIKSSATKKIGAPVPTIEFGERPWDLDHGTEHIMKKISKIYPKATVKNTQLVCYSYPKIGLKIDLKDPRLGEKSLIFDISDYTEVTLFGSDEMEGQTAWSFLDNLSGDQIEKNVRQWELRDQERALAREKSPKLFAKGFTKIESEKIKPTLVVSSNYIIPFFSSKVIKYSPRCNTHDCFELYGQQTSVYCAVATGQMILDFYRYYFDQDDIATAMGTGSGGTSNTGQVNGYESLSKKCLDATYDSSANWSEAKAEIDANRPLKSGIPGHARACAGWKKQNIFLIGQSPKRWLQIYDPWPWNSNICAGGQVYWEDWDAVTHTNFIYIRHRTSSCN